MTTHNAYATLWPRPLVSILLALIGLILALLTLLGLPLETQAALDPLFRMRAEGTNRVVIYEGNALKVSQTVTAVIVENISPSPVAIRISWNECDPHGAGLPGCQSYLDNWVAPGERVQQPLSNFYSVQIWAWDSSGRLVDSCSLPVVSPALFGTPSIKTPKRLAIYYAWPSLVNGAAGDLDTVTNVFCHFDLVVFGEGLEAPTHPDHDNTIIIIDNLRNRCGTEVYGYVTLSGISIDEIKLRVDRWVAMGVAGIFLDEAGRDYGVDRGRLREVIEYIHSKGVKVFINAWEPDDVFADDPPGVPTPLRAGDWYLAESHPVSAGQCLDLNFWWLKSFKVARYRDLTGVKIATMSTGDDSDCGGWPDYPPFRAALWGTYLFGFDAFGFTNPEYSASGPSADHICFLPPFPTYVGTRYLGPPTGPIIVTNVVTYSHLTDNGTIYVSGSSSTCDGGFLFAQKVFLPIISKQ